MGDDRVQQGSATLVGGNGENGDIYFPYVGSDCDLVRRRISGIQSHKHTTHGT